MISFLRDLDVEIIKELNVASVAPGTIARFFIQVVKDGMGMPTYLPIIVAKGVEPGPVVGVTAAVHGNELNGVPVVQKLFKEIDVKALRGTIVGVPVLNVPSFLRSKRRFIDDADLNHVFPGKANGNVSQVYAYRVINRIVKEFNFLVDLHTASFGRINSYYIRADLRDEVTRQMSILQNAQIIVHNPPSDGTLRGAAHAMGIRAITLEVGDPNKFQKGMIRSSLTGIFNLLVYLKMLEGKIESPDTEPVICDHSFWIYTDTGGILNVPPVLAERVKKGQVIATMRNIFGDLNREYFAPEDGIVIGKSISPINQTGGRILHLGLPVAESNGSFL